MGILSAFRSSGGGFLNGVDGVVVDYQLTTEPDFGGEQQARKKGENTPLWVKLTVKQDGAEATETTHLDAGAADDFVISDDGHTLTPVGEGSKLWSKTAWMRFIESAERNGVDFADYVPGTPIDFSAVINQRVRFEQTTDEDRMARCAKDFKANKGKARQYYNAEGEKKGKDGKFYPQRTLTIAQVYGTVEAPVVTATAPVVTKKAASGAKKAAVTPSVETNIKEFATDVLVTILGNAKDNKLSKSKVNYETTRLFTTSPYKEQIEKRDPARKFLYEDANLEALAADGIITFDKSSKDQTIALA